MTSDASRWEELSAFSDSYTCYSSAVATWAAQASADWRARVNPGLALGVFSAGEGLFGFLHFPSRLRSELGLARMGAEAIEESIEGVLEELRRSGRVIVAGDGFRLPWHVAHGRRHVPHWYVLTGAPDRIEVLDPFACRNELGVQRAARLEIERDQLGELLLALPGGDPVLDLRERLALGDDCPQPATRACQWLVCAELAPAPVPDAAVGPGAVRALARHFRERGQDPDAYVQADDIWSIGRHRAFLALYATELAERSADVQLAAWVREHAEPLAKRWAHMAPLMMQATLALGAGRSASGSVPDTLEDLAEREQRAAEAFPTALLPGTI